MQDAQAVSGNYIHFNLTNYSLIKRFTCVP